MDCLNSFTINLRGTLFVGGPETDIWEDQSQRYFALNLSNQFSRYNIQGFKTIEIYGVDVIGNIQHDSAQTGFGCLVTDWSFQVALAGTLPLVSGNVQTSPNYWNILATGAEPLIYRMSKNTNSIKLLSPIQSMQYVEFQGLFCQGTGVENGNAIGLEYHFDFIFYYRYQGE